MAIPLQMGGWAGGEPARGAVLRGYFCRRRSPSVQEPPGALDSRARLPHPGRLSKLV